MPIWWAKKGFAPPVRPESPHITFAATGTPDLQPLHAIVTRLVDEQLASAPPDEPSPDEMTKKDESDT